MRKNVKKIKINWLKNQRGSFSQVYSAGLQYALCSENYEQICKFVWCKDFLQDAYCAHINKCSKSIYGFQYKYGEDIPVSMDKIRILLTNKNDPRLRTKLKKAVCFLNQAEKELGIRKKSVLFECSDKPDNFQSDIFLIEGDKRWLLSPVMLSLYTLLIRVGCKHLKKHKNWKNTCDLMKDNQIQEYQSNDKLKLNESIKGIKHILKYGDKKVFGSDLSKNYPNLSTSILHNYSGICSFSKKTSAGSFPHWYSIDFDKNTPETFVS